MERQLHEEIQKLAERHRRPIVLCDLEGLTHEQAARLLGTPVGTIKSRLSRGRELLRRRLSRNGPALSDDMLIVAMAPDASRVEALGAVVDRTARTAMQVADRGSLIVGTVPATVIILVEGVLKSMFHSRLKKAAAAIVLSAGIAMGGAFAVLDLRARAGPTMQAAPVLPGPKRREIVNLVGHADLVRSAAFLPGGRELVSAAASSDGNKLSGEIRIWDVRASESRRTLKLDGDPFAMTVAPGGRTLSVAIARGETQDRTMIVRVLDLPAGETKQEWAMAKGGDVWSLAFAADGRSLAAGVGGLRDGFFYGEVRIWDTSTGKERPALTGHANTVMSLDFARDGSTLASSSGTYGAPVGEVRLWDVASGRLLRTMTEADVAVVTVAFAPDGNTVASGGTICARVRSSAGWCPSGMRRRARNR